MIIKQKLKNFFHKIIIVLLLFLLIIYPFHYSLKYESLKNSIKQKIESNINPVIHDYKFFNDDETTFLSLILNFSISNLNLLNNTLLDFLTDLSKSVFQDIQIILLHESSKVVLFNNSIKSFYKRRKIEIFSFNIKNWSKSFLDLLNLIKGKFIILINKICSVEIDGFKNIYNLTKGNIKNIIKIKNQYNEQFCLVRAKTLRDIIDAENQFNNFKDIYNYLNTLPSPKINYLPIVYCPNNYYASLTYTSMISILSTKEYYTYILFFIVVNNDFSKENILMIESLYEQFDYFNITFIKMDNRYEKAFINRYITPNTYYRMSLGELLPNLNKIIYLDSDTICLKDLSNLYNLNFNGKIFIARIISYKNGDHNFTVNAGVLLLNLVGMRRMKIENKVLTLLNNGFHNDFHDQAIINIFYKKYIGFLPPEFNSITFNYQKVKERNKNFGGLYDFDSLYFSFKFPYIIHYPGKPKHKTYNKEDWYYFARKSKYFVRRSHNYSKIFKFNSYKNML